MITIKLVGKCLPYAKCLTSYFSRVSMTKKKNIFTLDYLSSVSEIELYFSVRDTLLIGSNSLHLSLTFEGLATYTQSKDRLMDIPKNIRQGLPRKNILAYLAVALAKEKTFYNFDTDPCSIKLFTAVIIAVS
jgi:hypothetical protein